MSDSPMLRVAVTGATGFVGRHLCAALKERHQVIGLSRSAEPLEEVPPHPGLYWRQCELFDLAQTAEALKGVDVAYYLVHSMLPSARLTQGSFMNIDLILADNFARAAELAGIRQIIYLSGIIPPGAHLSRHLTSRLEVEEVLASGHTPVTVLRAGLVIGENGSSFSILVRLVEKLPVMVTPGWTNTPNQPIALPDAIECLTYCLDRDSAKNQTYDIGGPEITTYRQLIRDTAEALGKKPVLIPFPFFSPKLSRLWVSLVTRMPKELVAPLIQSLKHRLTTGNRRLQEQMGQDALPVKPAIERALRNSSQERSDWWAYAKFLLSSRQQSIKEARTVRSVQRLPLPPGRDAEWVAGEYARWLPQFFRPFILVRCDSSNNMSFLWNYPRLQLLELTHDTASSTRDRQFFFVTGGLLLRRSEHKGRLEFREVVNRRFVIAAIHDFTPVLPWFLYNISQALVHLMVMLAFGRHLDRVMVGAIAPEMDREEGPAAEGQC